MYKDEAWSVYEANVQAYRSNFLSSQSLLLAAGAIMYDKNVHIFCTIAAVAIFQMWYIWFRVIVSRVFIVDYHKFSLGKFFDENGNLVEGGTTTLPLNEKVYASNRAIRKKVNSSISRTGKIKDHAHTYNGHFTNIRLTRLKLDVLLPISLTAIWIVFAFELLWPLLR